MTPDIEIYESITIAQSAYQMKQYKVKQKNYLIFQEEYITLKAELTTLFGLDIKPKAYIYLLNFSMN